MNARKLSLYALCLALLPAIALGMGAAGPSLLTGQPLMAALERGGYVILMRHASSPTALPSAARADPGNIKHERQLDETGRASSRAMGSAFRRLQIPIGQVLCSPTYRALETARLAQFPIPTTFPELGDAGKSMSADTSGERGAWLRSRIAQLPDHGTNTLIITHAPNISEARPEDARNLADGEALVYRPDGQGSARLVARVHIEDWQGLAPAR